MGAILTIGELADEWMMGNRATVRHQLFSKCIDAQHACQLFASIAEQIQKSYGDEHALFFAKSFAAN